MQPDLLESSGVDDLFQIVGCLDVVRLELRAYPFYEAGQNLAGSDLQHALGSRRFEAFYRLFPAHGAHRLFNEQLLDAPRVGTDFRLDVGDDADRKQLYLAVRTHPI